MRTRAARAAGWLIVMVLSVGPLAADAKTEKPFRSVYFAFGNAELTPEAKEVLAAHASRLRERPGLRLEVQGWDDYFLGKADLRLSLKRVEEVRTFLAAQGLDLSRLKVRDMGAAPWDPGRRASPATLRRVDFVVLEAEPVPVSPAPAPEPAAAPPTPLEAPPAPAEPASPPPEPAAAPPAPEPVASAPAPAGTPDIQNPLVEEHTAVAVAPKRERARPTPPPPPPEPPAPPKPEREKAWAQPDIAHPAPKPRWGHSMVFDRAGRRIVVYGGTDGKVVFGDLWEFDLEKNRWMALAAGGGDPGSLAYHSAVYDAAAKRMVVFGGSPDRRTVTDAQWSLSLERGREAWVKIESPVAPGPRAAHGAAYDAERNRLVIFGGCARTLRSCRYTNDVWEMDLTLGAEKWTAIAPLNVPPPERESAAIFIRRSDQAMVVTGGFSARGYHRDTWVFNRQERQWKESGEFPGGGRCCAAYQAGEKGLVLFGGNDRRAFFDETWLFGGAKYARRDDPTHPPSRAFAAIVPTDEPNLYFLFGGRGNAGALGDFWALKLK